MHGTPEKSLVFGGGRWAWVTKVDGMRWPPDPRQPPGVGHDRRHMLFHHLRMHGIDVGYPANLDLLGNTVRDRPAHIADDTLVTLCLPQGLSEGMAVHDHIPHHPVMSGTHQLTTAQAKVGKSAAIGNPAEQVIVGPRRHPEVGIQQLFLGHSEKIEEVLARESDHGREVDDHGHVSGSNGMTGHGRLLHVGVSCSRA